MRTLIVGCGRVGASLARWLSAEGDDVTVVDSSERSFNRLGEEFTGEMVLGSAVDEDVLRRAGVERAEAFVAVTDSDTTNIMAAQLAKHLFGVKRAICRIYDPERQGVYADLGLETICPTTLGAEKVVRFFQQRPAPAGS
jgi:trk system potassium uptake protein TrkA